MRNDDNKCHLLYARLAQLVEQRTLNPWVAGSNPSTSTIPYSSAVRAADLCSACTRLVRGPGFESSYGNHLLHGSKSTINKIATTLLLHQKGLNIMGQSESCPAWRIGSAGAEENPDFSYILLTNGKVCGIMYTSRKHIPFL